jgi:PAS domain S-box-containing protein
MANSSLYLPEISVALGLVLILVTIFLIKNRKSNAKPDRTVNEMTLELSAAVAKLKAVISNCSGVIWSVDRDNTITLFRGLYLNDIGVAPDFIEGKKLDIARQKNRHLDIIENIQKVIAEGGSWDLVSDIDGKMFRSRITPVYDEDGNVTGVVGNTDDITETILLQKELVIAVQKAEGAVQALKSAQITVSAMFDSNPHMNILFDDNFKVVDCNPAAYSFLGFETKEEMLAGFIGRITQSIPEFQSSGRKSISIQERLLAAAKEGQVKFETELIAGGSTRIVSVEFKKIPYAGSFAIVAYVSDMTEIREREMEIMRRDQQLLEAVEEARAANKAKSAFLSNMSHEIRTPMNAILGITEIQLQNESLEPGTAEAFGKIYNSGYMLLGIINDILDLSKIEAGKLELVTAEYGFASFINDAVQLNVMRIGNKPIEFKLYLDENIPSFMIGDELRIKQILNNLLSNAFKYTAKGEVALSIYAETGEGGENEATMVFSVKDTGQGMTEEQVNKLFDEYYRFNLEANRTTEGTGLGMSITRNLIRMMNGRISVESEPGVGTVFTARIPQNNAGAGPLGKELVENLQQFRTGNKEYMKSLQISREPMPYGSVMVVDDVETNIYVAKGLLSPYGLKIDTADSGFLAVEKVKAGNVYDIIFMDHMMPKMDGLEATKIIREMGYRGTIVALTANAVIGQSDLFLNNGFNDFISKPIDIRQMNTVLNRFIRDKQPAAALEAAKRQAEEVKLQNGEITQPGVDPHFAEIFTRDALKTIAALDEIFAKPDGFSEEDIKTYVINIHGIKSALANIGRAKLAAAARELEQAGRDNNTGVMSAETPAFLSSLRALICELAPGAEKPGNETADEDRSYLLEKLLEIKTACEAYDKKTARNITADLREKSWSPPVREMLDKIAEQLLHSDFDEIVGIVTLHISKN